MLPDSTTTIGEEEFVATERPFQSMKAVERTRAKLRTWAASCRGCMLAIEPSIVVVVVEGGSLLLRDGGLCRMWFVERRMSYSGSNSSCVYVVVPMLNADLEDVVDAKCSLLVRDSADFPPPRPNASCAFFTVSFPLLTQ
jgi:hypothetical protein